MNLGGDKTEYIQSQLISCKVSNKSLYKILLRNCLALDMSASVGSIKDSTQELLSPESKTLLRAFGKQWAVGQAFQIIAYLEILFDKYQKFEVPTSSLMTALEAVHGLKHKTGWISSYDVSFSISSDII